MARTWRLTRQAEESLFEIYRWTLETFGPAQAASYHDDLIACCRGVAARKALTQRCRERLDPALSADLWFARSGMHLVIFTEIGTEVVVVDFLHQQVDLPRRLRDLPGSGQQ